jgi:endonuclease YncB( thermonuclease family)
MKVRRLSVMAAAALVCASMAVGETAQAQTRRPSDVLALGSTAKVTNVIDGDTIEVSQNGNTFLVNYLGVATPGLDACYGTQAKQANAALVQGKTIIIEQDTTDFNASGAAPRYVYLVDGRMVNEELLKAGQAVASTQLSDAKYQASLNALAAQAQQAKRGGWARCGWQAEAPVKDANGCLALTVADLDQRVEKPSILGALKDGDCVTISGTTEDGAAWSGQFMYHPAGSAVTQSPGFVRWKDGFVLIERNPEDASQLVAHVSQYRQGEPVEVTIGGRVFKVPSREKVLFQAVLPLERDPGDASVVRLPVTNTWIARDLGNGQYQALVDFFEYKSGDLKLP